MRQRYYYVYIVASRIGGTLYIGVTKRLKKWKREWKIELIEKTNPNWIDLYPTIASP